MNSPEIKIRNATKDDYKIVNSLYYQTYSLYHKELPKSYKKTPRTVLSLDSFIELLKDENLLFIVVENKKKVLGFLHADIETYKSDEIVRGYRRVFVYELSVLDKYQNQGIGSLLLKEAEKWAKERNISDLSVLAYAFSKNAVSFYEKNGFTQYSIQLDKKI